MVIEFKQMLSVLLVKGGTDFLLNMVSDFLEAEVDGQTAHGSLSIQSLDTVQNSGTISFPPNIM